MTSPAYPRLLFCTWEIPQLLNAGSMQLFRALHNWPSEQLVVMGPPPDPQATLLACPYHTLVPPAYRLSCTRFREWTIGANAWVQGWTPGINADVRRLGNWRPDLVVTVMDKLSYYKHAWALARRLRAGLVTITMDDPQVFETTRPVFQPAYDRLLKRIYQDAVLSLGVSQEMVDDLGSRFGKPSKLLQFGPHTRPVPRDPSLALNLRSPGKFIIGYTGALGLGYGDGFASIIPVLEQAGVTVHFYGRENHPVLNHPCIVHRGFHSVEKLWPLVQDECDALVLPYSFGADWMKVYRTHFPTKLSEYCWSGLPMILIGPETGTAIRWGYRHPDAAVTVDRPEAARLLPLLRQLAADGPLRVNLAAAALKTARQEFDPAVTLNRFREYMQHARTDTP
jgi:hypothetical protein